MSLEELLQNRCWLRKAEPFPHILASNVLHFSHYLRLEKAIGELMQCNKSGAARPSDSGVSPHQRRLGSDCPEPMQIFCSAEWHKLFSELHGIEFVADIDYSISSFQIGPTPDPVESGIRHGWFTENQRSEILNVSDAARCDSDLGANPENRSTTRRFARAAVLFYFSASMQQGQESARILLRDGATPSRRAPPASISADSNSLVSFKCTPQSWFEMRSNLQEPTYFITVWFHQSLKTDSRTEESAQ